MLNSNKIAKCVVPTYSFDAESKYRRPSFASEVMFPEVTSSAPGHLTPSIRVGAPCIQRIFSADANSATNKIPIE